MGWIEPSHVLFLPIVLAAGAAAWLYAASVVKRARHRRRARKSFLLGFAAGWTAATFLRGRRSRPAALRALSDAKTRALALATPLTIARRSPSGLRQR